MKFFRSFTAGVTTGVNFNIFKKYIYFSILSLFLIFISINFSTFTFLRFASTGAGEDGLTGNASIGGAWRAMKNAIIQADLGIISSEKEYDELVEAQERQWDSVEKGALMPVLLLCAKKPVS